MNVTPGNYIPMKTVGIGEYIIGRDPMSAIGLGSCIGLVLHDSERGVGCLVHIMLPSSQGKTERPGKYADTAVSVCISEMNANGSRTQKLVAKITGGASMLKNFNGNLNIGDRNAEAVKLHLQERRIPVLAIDTGGNFGRTIVYYPENGLVTVRRADGTNLEL